LHPLHVGRAADNIACAIDRKHLDRSAPRCAGCATLDGKDVDGAGAQAQALQG
jgi:hypothetical protein